MARDWIIDKSHIGKFAIAETQGDVSLCTVPVKIYDDDDVLYLEARVSPQMLDSDESDAFSLLDAAAVDLGATRMIYKDPGHGWITL
jgi:hypothetical protein